MEIFGLKYNFRIFKSNFVRWLLVYKLDIKRVMGEEVGIFGIFSIFSYIRKIQQIIFYR